MPDKFTALTPELHSYLVAHSGPPDELLERLAADTEAAAGGRAVMQIAPEQGALMALLCRAIGARRALELGTFTGYSAICIARALAADGRLVTCDVSEDWTRLARRYFEETGLAHRIELRLGPALETLAELRGGEPFDFAFIDADKTDYPEYHERIVQLLRSGGLAVYDNVFWGGEVIDQSKTDQATVGVRRLNERLATDERVTISMIPVADGLTLALKR
jgi:caffeoyl-CoA O-methyltransferase